MMMGCPFKMISVLCVVVLRVRTAEQDDRRRDPPRDPRDGGEERSERPVVAGGASTEGPPVGKERRGVLAREQEATISSEVCSIRYDVIYSLSLSLYDVVLCYGALFIISMEERKQEISVHRDILKAELKVLNDDRHNITMELRSRQANVDRLKARFDSVARSETEETHSQAYYIIKAAQKREELQRKGR